jgi:orotate phosphoribosyltransferase
MPSEKKGEDLKTETCKILDHIGAVKFGAFKLTSGRLSPYYIDLRIVPSFPDAFEKVCEAYAKLIKTEVGLEHVDRIAGIPVAGIPFASVVALNLRKPFLYVRKGARTHGRERRIEGIIAPGNRVLLIDDLITGGLSLLRAAKAIMAEGGVVEDAVVLIDRQEGGKDKLAKSGVKLHALLSIDEVVKTLHELGSIDDDQVKTILKQVKKK